jgi:hypothetical protein
LRASELQGRSQELTQKTLGLSSGSSDLECEKFAFSRCDGGPANSHVAE